MSGTSDENRPAPSPAGPPPSPAKLPQIPVDIDPDEVLDWDAGIEVAPLRPTRRIKVRLRDLGRDKPLPIEDPHDDLG